MCVFGLKSFNFIVERILFWQNDFKVMFFDQLTALSKLMTKIER